ncbi:MAG TPA: protein kinase [Gemmataceae bacterium]|jgi:RNA polymerase sigma factor (sigma-70 family)|nr:protein kinase [Gemmataceae bacterium]
MSASEHWTSAELLARFCSGDQSAADQLFHRYAERLILLTRARLSSRLAAKADPEDVAMSAWRSFFIGARRGQFALNEQGDLWRLLVSITLHKLYHQARHHAADRRSIAREQSLEQTAEELVTSAKSEPTVEEALALADEVEAIMANLDADGRRVLELRLQGEQFAAIAQLTGRSERTVRRILAQIRELFANRFGGELHVVGLPQVETYRSQIEKTLPKTPEECPSSGVDQAHAHLESRDYLLQRMLGAGRFGKVYSAQQKSVEQIVAIKYLRKSYLSSPEIVGRFLEEARTLARLHHPGIVALHGMGRTPAGSYFIVMDWIEGPNLDEILKAGPVPPERAVQWALQICSALAYAHDQGILHCDVKPSNFIANHNDRVFVTDFGLARPLMRPPELLDRIEGTPAFMAPEQVADWWGPITCRTDVYGLGAVLFTLLTGQPPWPEKRLADILGRILTSEPVVTADSLRPEIPKRLSQICQRCLAKRPSERYASMDEVRAALAGGE